MEASGLELGVFTELDDEGLADALAGARSRGIYKENIIKFLESGTRGVEVNLKDGVHEAKKPQSVKTGYDSAREAIAENKDKNTTYPDELVASAKATKVVLKNDRVFLIRQDA